MKFAELNIEKDVIRALVGMVDSGKIPHAIMFHEEDGGGAMALVQAFLQYLYCRNKADGDCCGACPTCNKISKLIHPDVHYIYPVNSGRSIEYVAKWRQLVQSNPLFTENDLSEALEIEGKSAMIKVEESKALLDILSLSALERGYRAVVIYLPEKMNREAANRLLKAIEEPPALTQFLLVTHAPENVLTTIASRCQRIRIAPNGKQSGAKGRDDDAQIATELISALLAKDLSTALEAGDAAASLPSRERCKQFCGYMAAQLRYVFLLQQGVDALVDVSAEEKAQLTAWASKMKKTFPRYGLDALSRAQGLIDRNVSLKILFTDLVDRLYKATI